MPLGAQKRQRDVPAGLARLQEDADLGRVARRRRHDADAAVEDQEDVLGRGVQGEPEAPVPIGRSERLPEDIASARHSLHLHAGDGLPLGVGDASLDGRAGIARQGAGGGNNELTTAIQELTES